MENDFWTHLESTTVEYLMTIGVKLIYATIVLIAGLVLIRIIMRLLKRVMVKANTELVLRSFVMSFSLFLLYAFLIIGIGLTFGIEASAFITLLGALGIAVGLALQGSLSNFAGGLLILLFKPFKVGDEVIINGIEGEVADINILYTHVHNWRGEYYSIPNGEVSNNTVKNCSSVEFRRVQIELHFSFDEDVDKLREIITSTLKKHPKVIQDKPFQLWINQFEEYYIKMSARCWCKSSEFWGVYWEQEEAVKKVLDKHGIKLAIPTQTIHQPDKHN